MRGRREQIKKSVGERKYKRKTTEKHGWEREQKDVQMEVNKREEVKREARESETEGWGDKLRGQ